MKLLTRLSTYISPLMLGLGLLSFAPVMVTANPLPAKPIQIASTYNNQAARQLFSQYAALFKTRDPKILDLFANNATIFARKNLEATGEVNEDSFYSLTKPEFREILAYERVLIKKKGINPRLDLELYNVTYQPYPPYAGNQVQITVEWTSPKDNSVATQILIVGRDNKGRWMIDELYDIVSLRTR